MTHPVLDDLNWRYTCKHYDPTRKVSENDLAILFEAMRLSASSINSQPWKFIVIESDEAKQRMFNSFEDKHENNRKHVFDSSHTILFAHNPRYTRDDYAKVIDQGIADGRTKPQDRDTAFNAYRFAENNTNEEGINEHWTRAQTYLALGNTLHTLARLHIDSTPLEGINVEMVNREFAVELDGYRCDVALAIGYHHPDEDYNANLPKSRLPLEAILKRL